MNQGKDAGNEGVKPRGRQTEIDSKTPSKTCLSLEADTGNQNERREKKMRGKSRGGEAEKRHREETQKRVREDTNGNRSLSHLPVSPSEA